MSIWSIGPISEQPSVSIVDWSIKETNNGRYFVGTELPHHSGRVSTQIIEYDAEKKIGRTVSGRIYQLLGEPGYSSNGEYVWGAYMKVNGLVEI
ncbi:hypothetical protein D3C87_279150 [compost metagenome]